MKAQAKMKIRTPIASSLRFSIVIAMVFTLLTPMKTPALAVADGLVDCGTSGTFTIVSNIVTTNNLCVGSLNIPEGVSEIKRDAFNIAPERSSYITSITFPNSLRTIQESAFRRAYLLTSLNFGTGVQTISHWNFADSTELTAVTIPSSLTSMGVGVFLDSTKLQSVTFLGNAPSVDQYVFLRVPVGATANVNSSATGFGANGSTWNNLVVSVALAAPSFTISSASGSATTGSAITSYTLDASGGGTVESYAISPAISNGTLSFSTSTGLLSGTPSTAASATTYTITAHNATAPDATRTYSLTINAPVPVVVYVPPTPVPYLKVLTPPRMQMEPTQLLCFAGTYNFGYTLDGVIQGSSTSYYKPPYPYIFKLIINGVSQSLQPKPGFQGTGVWDIASVPSGSIASCSVTVSVNTVTNTAMSTELNDENKSKLSVASSDLNQSIKDANTLYTDMLLIYSNAYKDTLSNNRKTWRTNAENIRASYNNELARITSLGANWPNYTRSLKSEALKKYITEIKENAADYRASGPAALVAKNHGNQLALDQKNAWITAANSSYGSIIESIGYGVVIP